MDVAAFYEGNSVSAVAPEGTLENVVAGTALHFFASAIFLPLYLSCTNKHFFASAIFLPLYLSCTYKHFFASAIFCLCTSHVRTNIFLPLYTTLVHRLIYILCYIAANVTIIRNVVLHCMQGNNHLECGCYSHCRQLN